MAHVSRQAPVEGQHQVDQNHYHANSQRPAFVFSGTGDRNCDDQCNQQNTGYRNKYASTLNPATSSWKPKIRQSNYQKQYNFHQSDEDHGKHDLMDTFNPQNGIQNQESNGCFDKRDPSHFEFNGGKKAVWNIHTTMAQNLINATINSFSSNTRGHTSSVGAIVRTAMSLEKQFEKSEDPGLLMIQTLLEIGYHFGQAQKRLRGGVEEERASRVVIDTFQSYLSRWECGDVLSGNERSDSGFSVYSSSSTSSSNRNGNGVEVGYEHRNKKNEGVDLISWDSEDEEKVKVDLLAKVPESNKQQPVRPRPITQVHRQALLNAILEGNNALQVFLVIDAFGLNELLSAPAPLSDAEAERKETKHSVEENDRVIDQVEHDSNEEYNEYCNEWKTGFNYGSLLIMNLTQRGYLHAAIQLNLRLQSHRHNKNRSYSPQEDKIGVQQGVNQAQQMLIDHLLDRGYADLIHLLVGTDQELCRAVLQTIDNRCAKQIWVWVEGQVIVAALLDPILAIQCRAQASPSSSSSGTELKPPGLPSYQLPLLLGMLDIAISLGYLFELENTMKGFRSIQFIQEYCTVFSLLHQHRSPYTTMHESFNLSPCIFIPALLPILNNNVALQRLVVWTFARYEDGIATADILASALELKAFFIQCLCLGYQNKKEEESEKELQLYQQQHLRITQKDELLRRGVREMRQLNEQVLGESHGQIFEMSTDYGEDLVRSLPFSSISSSKGKERCISPQEKESHFVSKRENKSCSNSAFVDATIPRSNAYITRMSGCGFDSHKQSQDYNNTFHGNNNHSFNHNHNQNYCQQGRFDFKYTRICNYAASLAPRSLGHQAPVSYRPLPQPLQSKSSSTATSYPATAMTPQPSYPYPPHPPISLSNSKIQRTNSSKLKNRVPPQIYMCGYKADPEVTIILVNDMSQLELMYESLFYAGVVGMSLVRPLAKPWAKGTHAQPPISLRVQSLFKLNDPQQQQDQDQDLEQQQFGPKQENSKRDSDSESDSDNTSNGTGAGGVFLQLACHNDKRVYVIDLEIFLDKSVDSLHKLPRLLGEIFFNPSICKLVYNWNEESKLLKKMFPVLRESRYHMDNYLDFYFLWIAYDLPTTTPVTQPQSKQSQSQNPITASANSNKVANGKETGVLKIKAWCTEKPLLPTTMLQPRFRNVSGLMYRVMGKFLRRTSSLDWNAWMIRPLPVCLQTDLAISAQCLVDMFTVLDKPGARRGKDETAEFKLQHKFVK